MSDPEEMLAILENPEDSNEEENKYLKRLLRKEFKIKYFERKKKKNRQVKHYYESSDEISLEDKKDHVIFPKN